MQLPIKLEGMEEPIAFDRSQVALSARTADEDFPPPTPRTIAAWKNAAVERCACMNSLAQSRGVCTDMGKLNAGRRWKMLGAGGQYQMSKQRSYLRNLNK